MLKSVIVLKTDNKNEKIRRQKKRFWMSEVGTPIFFSEKAEKDSAESWLYEF